MQLMPDGQVLESFLDQALRVSVIQGKRFSCIHEDTP
jgi:hypothetical protein